MRHENGFTLIELLVVLAIIGAITAVAIPQYAAYRTRAFDTQAKLDLRNAALAEEAYFLDFENYLSCSDSQCKALPGIVKLTKGVTLKLTATATGFIGEAKHSKGSKSFQWDSSLGGLQD